MRRNARSRSHDTLGWGRRGLLVFRLDLRRTPLFKRLAGNQHLDLCRIQRLAFEQRFSDPNQGFPIFRQDRFGPVVALENELPDFLVNRD